MSVISWDQYFMGIAELTAKRSKDPSTQVGACIADKHHRIVGTGYNGFPTIGGIGRQVSIPESNIFDRVDNDKQFPWDSGESMDDPNSKYPFVVHAEPNAILNSNKHDLTECRIYVTLFPCNNCAKLIAQSGISQVIYLDDKYADLPMTKNAKIIFDTCGIRYRQIDHQLVELFI